MNCSRPVPSPSERQTVAIERRQAAPVQRHHYPARDFGVGYGNSSGYASEKRYTRTWGQPRFRFG